MASLLVAMSISLVGTVVTSSVTAPVAGATTAPPGGAPPAYWLAAADGGVFSFGGLPFYGSMGGKPLDKPVVGMSSTPDGKGYWLVASDGGIFSFGDAPFYGSMGGKPLDKPVVGMAVDHATGGYWLVASDGGIFSFGAPFYRSMGGKPIYRPVVGMVPTPDDGGYWLVASDGGVFSFGDAQFYGSMGEKPLNKPVVGMATTSDGGGYWLVASDGGIFSFGDAGYYGSMGGQVLTYPVVGMTSTPDGQGYWMTNSNGGVYRYGDAGYYGSAPQHLAQPVVGMTEAPGSGAEDPGPYQSGSYGYDISNYQCAQAANNTLPGGNVVGVVQVEGESFGPVNPCLAKEAQWAGSGLNLYVFLTFGNQANGPQVCNNDTACDYGYAAAQQAYGQAQSVLGSGTQVTWWLDVEGAGLYWSSNTTENAALIQGAIMGLQAEGINNVGIYASPDVWNQIVGNYQPAVPYWVAWWTGNPQANCTTLSSYATSHNDLLPTGGLWMTQYTDDISYQGTVFDGDYAC